MARNRAIDRLGKQLAQRIERDLYGTALVDAAVLQRGSGRNGQHYHHAFLSWVEPHARGYRVVLMNTARHASIIEEGQRPHVIEARRARTLAFPGPSGKTVFPRKVHHPGAKGYRVLGGALDTVLARSYLRP